MRVVLNLVNLAVHLSYRRWSSQTLSEYFKYKIKSKHHKCALSKKCVSMCRKELARFPLEIKVYILEHMLLGSDKERCRTLSIRLRKYQDSNKLL